MTDALLYTELQYGICYASRSFTSIISWRLPRVLRSVYLYRLASDYPLLGTWLQLDVFSINGWLYKSGDVTAWWLTMTIVVVTARPNIDPLPVSFTLPVMSYTYECILAGCKTACFYFFIICMSTMCPTYNDNSACIDRLSIGWTVLG
jgi:hypothetical protein